ncbi:MAG: SurA N-terminal domain-containing protein [Clostridia bacterium]|nr:SurA N-terminal domain-containing protein [Clostridia bacterium]
MKKLFALLIICLLTITGTLAGCATFSIDKVKYYNEVVAKVGDKNITRYELLNAYESYGYNAYSVQGSKSEKEAIAETLELLIDRELLYQYGLENKDLYKPNDYQVNQAIQNIFDNLDSQFDSLISQAKLILDIKTEKPQEEPETTSDAKVYNFSKDYKYNKRAEIVIEDGKYVIQYIVEPEKVLEANDALVDIEIIKDYENKDIVADIIDAYFIHLNEEHDYLGNDLNKVVSKAISIMTTNIINNQYYLRDENGKPFSKETKDIIRRYFEDYFDSEIKSLYLENIRTDYLTKESKTFDLNELIEEYDYLVGNDQKKYKNRESAYKEALKGAGTNADSILHHRDLSDDTKFGYFVHTLLTFSEGQKTAITQLDNKLKAGIISQETYDKEYGLILANTKVMYREQSINDDGETIYTETETKKSLGEIINDYNKVDNLEEFIDFMFKYTGDADSTLKAGMPYVVGTNGNSKMVEEFNAEAIRLMGLGKDSMSDTISIDNDMVDIDAQNLCVTSYGIHLLYYVGEVGSTDIDPEYAVINLDENDVNNLFKVNLNPLTEKSYFDMLFDVVYPAGSTTENYTSNNGYSDFEKGITDSLDNKVTRYSTKIKGTKTNI